MSQPVFPGPFRQHTSTAASLLVAATLAVLSACSGSGGSDASASAAAAEAASLNLPSIGPASSAPVGGTPLPQEKRLALSEISRFMSQATFGPTSPDELVAIQTYGFEQWMMQQFDLPAASQLDYVKATARLREDGRPIEENSYEAIWQQWLYGKDQLRARVAFALSQILVISNIAPDLNPLAMSSYMDMLNRNAFGNYRTLLEEVTLHPAMGYYLNMLGSEKEDPESGRLPNENYAREILQLFSIGLVKLNPDGTPVTGPDGQPIPTYDQQVVLGFAKAFSGWSFGGRNAADPDAFQSGDENWTVPMQPWAQKHSAGPKLLFDGRVIAGGQSPRKDMTDALDAIFQHPNVGPFVARRLIQRLVTSNPSPAYVGRVAAVFGRNALGQRGDLKAVVWAILLDPEARDASLAASNTAGKQREPVIRFANLLRGLGARSANGRNAIHYLDSADNALGQSPLLSPTVFNFYSPDYKMPGPTAQAGLVAPEFQITNETTVVGTLNFFANLVQEGGYGWDESRLALDYAPLEALAADPAKLIDRLGLMFMNDAVSPQTRAAMMRTLTAIPASDKAGRVKAALTLTAVAPDFVIQR